jgi:nucleotide-binding universal stress UspA family protein
VWSAADEEREQRRKDVPMFRTIVVPLDHSDAAEAAVPHAAALARQAGAHVSLLMVRPSYVDGVTIHDRLNEIADRHHLDADLIVVGPDDVTAVLVEAASAPDTLLCLASHARGPLSELVMGSVSEDVVRLAHHPVLLIGPHCGPPAERYPSMLVGLDGSELAERILPTVARWASELDVAPCLLQVLPERVPLEVGESDVVESGYVHTIANQLGERSIKADWDVVHHRDPAEAITRFARDGRSSLIALTTHGRSGLSRVALGSVALRVAHHAPCPVLVLRPAEVDDRAVR